MKLLFTTYDQFSFYILCDIFIFLRQHLNNAYIYNVVNDTMTFRILLYKCTNSHKEYSINCSWAIKICQTHCYFYFFDKKY